MKIDSRSRVSVFLVIMILFWGSSFVVVKLVLKEGLSPVAIATYRFLIAGGIFLILLSFHKENRRMHGFYTSRDLVTLVLLSLTGVTFYFILQYTGIQMASASIASIFVCLLSPILISVLSTLILKERFTRKHFLGVAVASLGTFMVITGGSLTVQNNLVFLYGSMLLLITPLLWAIYSILGKKMIETHDPFQVVAYVHVLGGLFLIPFFLYEGSLHLILEMTLRGWIAILFLSIACSVIGYLIWFYAIRELGASVTSSFLFAEPVVTVALGTMFLGESLGIITVLGTALVFLGVYLVVKR